MHDIRKHVGASALSRAASSDSSVWEVLETTEDLADAFASRKVAPLEPFVGAPIGLSGFKFLGPSRDFYQQQMEAVTNIPIPQLTATVPFGTWGSGILGGPSLGQSLYAPPKQVENPGFFGSLFAPPKQIETPGLFGLSSLIAAAPSYPSFVPMAGVLARAAVKEKPRTQPFNETSVILGVAHLGVKLMLTADVGSEGLAHVPAEWHDLDYCSVPHHGSDGNFSKSDIERFRPKFACISAKGDLCHPSRAVVSALRTVGSKVASTHKYRNLRYFAGSVPYRHDYTNIEFPAAEDN
jgi:hypothetical protein